MQLLIMMCAVSAGVHAVLAPAHFQESATLGFSFGAAALALAGLAVVLDRRPQSGAAIHIAALVFGVLIVAYAATRISALPLLGNHAESLDAVGVGTKVIEALGLALAVKSINHRAADQKPSTAEKGVLS